MLVDLLGYAWWKTHEEAERIEHAMSDEMEERLGQSAAVERIPDQFEHEPGFLEYLDSVGLRPGVRVQLVAIDEGTLRTAVDGKERSVRRDCGRKVLVAL